MFVGVFKKVILVLFLSCVVRDLEIPNMYEYVLGGVC